VTVTNRRRLLVALPLVAVSAVIGVITCDPYHYSRSLPCASLGDSRSVEICHAVERNLEYRCCGHAIVDPE
jgi:hypothetical protein